MINLTRASGLRHGAMPPCSSRACLTRTVSPELDPRSIYAARVLSDVCQGPGVDGIQNTVRPPVVARTPPLLHTVARRRAPAPRALVSSFSFLLKEVSLHGVLVREHSCASCSPSASWALPHDPRGQLPLAGGPVLFLRENLLTAYSRCGDMPHASPGWDAVSRNKRLSPAWAAQRLTHWDGLSGAP